MKENVNAIKLCSEVYKVTAKIRELYSSDVEASMEFNRIAREIEDTADQLYDVDVSL